MNIEPPACDVCGSVMVRTGDEWHCLDCGNKMKIGVRAAPSDVALLAQARTLAREAVDLRAKALAIIRAPGLLDRDGADTALKQAGEATAKLLALLTEGA